jgi:hypothetical protein
MLQRTRVTTLTAETATEEELEVTAAAIPATIASTLETPTLTTTTTTVTSTKTTTETMTTTTTTTTTMLPAAEATTAISGAQRQLSKEEFVPTTAVVTTRGLLDDNGYTVYNAYGRLTNEVNEDASAFVTRQHSSICGLATTASLPGVDAIDACNDAFSGVTAWRACLEVSSLEM